MTGVSFWSDGTLSHDFSSFAGVLSTSAAADFEEACFGATRVLLPAVCLWVWVAGSIFSIEIELAAFFYKRIDYFTGFGVYFFAFSAYCIALDAAFSAV